MAARRHGRRPRWHKEGRHDGGRKQPGALLSARGLCKSFGGIRAVKDISFDVMPGEILGLIGPNGAGKTTCFNLITGFYQPSAGTVSFRGQDMTGAKPFAVAQKGIVRSFQKTNILKPLTVFENVLAGHYLEARQSLLRRFPRAARATAESAVRESAAGDRGDHGSVQAHECAGLSAVLRRAAPAGGGGGAGRQARAC